MLDAFKRLRAVQKEERRELEHIERRIKESEKKVVKHYAKVLHLLKEKETLLKKEKKREEKEEIKKELVNYKGWIPRIWSNNGIQKSKVEIYPLFTNYATNFDIYVSSDKKFAYLFPNYDIKDTFTRKFSNREKPSLDNPYHISLFAGYVFGSKCGFSREHMKNESDNVPIPTVVSCLGKYFLYFHNLKFLVFG